MNYYSRLKSILNNNNTIFQNLSYISILHVFNMLIPLATYPYLIRVLEKETYGLVIFAQAVIGYFAILVGFGFNISATKEISIHRHEKNKISEIVSSVFIIKGALCLISVLLFFLLFLFLDEAKNHKTLFIITLYLCIYEWLFPIWYFQGIEKMKYITFLNVLSRTVFLILIFVLIKSKEDYLFFPIVNGVGSILASFIALYIVFKKHKINLYIPNANTLMLYFKDSIPIFTSNLSLKLYLSSNKIIIGLFLGMQEVSFYDLGEKLLNLLKIPINVISQVLFPKMSNDFNKTLLLKIARLIVVCTLLITILVEMFAPEIIVIFAGKDMIGALDAIRILMLSVTPLVISNILGVQTLLTNGYNQQFLIVVFASFCVYGLYIVCCYLIGAINLYTICISYLLVEVYMLLHFAFYVKKYKLLLVGQTQAIK